MRFRKLQIAWAAAWGVVALLLCVLWVRSYWWTEIAVVPVTPNASLGVGSLPGVIGIALVYDAVPWQYHRTDIDDDWRSKAVFDYSSRYVGGFYLDSNQILTPYWFVVGIAFLISLLPRLPWKFSLRTLLIATTLVAVLLGLLVWLIR